MSKGAIIRAKQARAKMLKERATMQKFNQTAFASASLSHGTDPAKFANHGKYYFQQKAEEQR